MQIIGLFYLLGSLVWGRWLLLGIAAFILYRQAEKLNNNPPYEKQDKFLRDTEKIAWFNWFVLGIIWLCYVSDLLGYKDFSAFID